MKSFQVTEFGKPLELKVYEIPTPKNSELLVKNYGLWCLS